MRKSLLTVNSIAGGALLTLVVAGGTLLFLMFSAGEEDNVRKEGLFGSLFFEAHELANGATGVTMGVANPTGLVVTFVFCAVFLSMCQLGSQALKRYCTQLLQERRHQ